MSTAEALHSLKAPQRLCSAGAMMPLCEASARVFQGRSKELDDREELLRLPGAAPRQFHKAPIQLLVDIRAGFDKAWFVEHLVSLEHLVTLEHLVAFEPMADRRWPAWSRSLLVYAAGFKGSARRFRTRQSCRP